MDSHNILSLLGLALRGGRLVMGEEPVEAVARARDARVLLLASDAAAGRDRAHSRDSVSSRDRVLRKQFFMGILHQSEAGGIHNAYQHSTDRKQSKCQFGNNFPQPFLILDGKFPQKVSTGLGERPEV